MYTVYVSWFDESCRVYGCDTLAEARIIAHENLNDPHIADLSPLWSIVICDNDGVNVDTVYYHLLESDVNDSPLYHIIIYDWNNHRKVYKRHSYFDALYLARSIARDPSLFGINHVSCATIYNSFTDILEVVYVDS